MEVKIDLKEDAIILSTKKTTISNQVTSSNNMPVETSKKIGIWRGKRM